MSHCGEHRADGPAVAAAHETPGSPEIIVLHTGLDSTLCGLRTASQLARGLAIRIRLLALHCVPYPLKLEEPAVHREFLIRSIRELMLCTQSHQQTPDGAGSEMAADIRLCRDEWQTLRDLLAPQSVIVIGRNRSTSRWWRWWPFSGRADRLAKKLRAAGHHVVRTTNNSNSNQEWTHPHHA